MDTEKLTTALRDLLAAAELVARDVTRKDLTPRERRAVQQLRDPIVKAREALKDGNEQTS
ncbi:MAG: hypothetical protein AAFN41_11315 [Planctomycetota bacterium]